MQTYKCKLFSALRNNYFTGVKIDTENIDPSKVANIDAAKSKYPLTVRKIKNIHSKLTAYGFASSIE